VPPAKYFGFSAAQGFALGPSNLGYCLVTGKDITKDLAAAAKQFEFVSDQGLAAGQFNFGFCLLHGQGIAMDQTRGAELIHKALDQEYLPAHVNYGTCLLQDAGVKSNMRAAAEVFAKTKRAGDTNRFFEVQLLDTVSFVDEIPRPPGFDDLIGSAISELQTSFDATLFETIDDIPSSGRLDLIKRMRRKSDVLDRAVKFFTPGGSRSNNEVFKHYFRELYVLLAFHHPCIMPIIGFQLPDGGKDCAIATLFMRNGSLADILADVRAGKTVKF
jgi:hypothetical protein